MDSPSLGLRLAEADALVAADVVVVVEVEREWVFGSSVEEI